MKILYIIDKPNMYGSERHLLDILRHFSNEEGYHIDLIAFSEGEMLNHVKQCNFSVFKINWLVNIFTFTRLYFHIKNISPDVIHCHQPKALFIGSLLAQMLNIPSVITIHSKAYDHSIIHKNKFRRWLVYSFHKTISFFSEMCANKIIYVNEKMFDTAAYKNKSLYISNWLPKGYDEGEVRNLKFKKANKLKFVSVGSVTKAKGYDLLLEFFGCLNDSKIEYSAKIFGGNDNAFYSELKQHKSFSYKTEFVGYSDSLADAYNDADFYVLFSRSETFGLSYLEAMSQGLPIIALDLDELKVLIPSRNALAPNVGDAYRAFLDMLNPEYYKSISNDNILRSKEFSYSNRMKQLELTYRGLVTSDYI
ncbi:glycosyltransferase family 4 protein [Vibrio aestuarianus subsp. cardii]|uniref:glycosyltransferase family 4 protein n=1 Tax=Vibrio aestuarianus TaxID=28171 RepID=UPI00159380C7|nr:glycosyltransferase family 4 protein [Vibrio aestuarianus]MDE1309881.1 glycosyltransferase family 4 protein [Vibrio aestuarianus]NGZ18936.1 glycosyltransferase family 4 protein [Vibrio aestuarianus]NGZ93969.1 glycosyltransferase family 4 protein [Vibrio aestuarianus subsp. cardii]